MRGRREHGGVRIERIQRGIKMKAFCKKFEECEFVVCVCLYLSVLGKAAAHIVCVYTLYKYCVHSSNSMFDYGFNVIAHFYCCRPSLLCRRRRR